MNQYNMYIRKYKSDNLLLLVGLKPFSTNQKTEIEINCSYKIGQVIRSYTSSLSLHLNSPDVFDFLNKTYIKKISLININHYLFLIQGFSFITERFNEQIKKNYLICNLQSSRKICYNKKAKCALRKTKDKRSSQERKVIF